MSAYDVIVIGAGVMGSAAAYQTAKRGKRTLLLEQYDFLHNRASSHGESRTIRASYPSNHYMPMVIESAKLWEQAQAEIGFQVYHKARQMDIGPSDAPGLNAIIQNLRYNNLPATPIDFKVLNSRELKQEFNGNVHVPEDWIGVVSSVGGIIKATKAVAMFQALAVKNGATLRDNTQVTKICKESGLIEVRAANGQVYKGRKCIVTVGAWMTRLLEQSGVKNVPIQPLEVYLCYWKVKQGHEDKFSLQGPTPFPTFASYGYPRIYGTPCYEYPGLFKACLHEGYPCDPNVRNWTHKQNPQSLELLKKWVHDRSNGLIETDRPASATSCMYSVTPDEDYIIDFVGGSQFGKDVVIAGGFSGHGFKMAPAIGRILADLAITGDAKNVNLPYFSLERFKKNPKGNVKEIKQVGQANL